MATIKLFNLRIMDTLNRYTLMTIQDSHRLTINAAAIADWMLYSHAQLDNKKHYTVNSTTTTTTSHFD